MAGNHVAKELKASLREGVPGISKKAIEEHYGTLYQGYVKKLNEIELALEAMNSQDRANANASFSQVRSLKKEEVFVSNAIALHEEYFDSLGGNGVPEGELLELIKRDFGSFEKWVEDFRAAGMAARGWVVLAYNWYDNKLHNYSSDIHSEGVWGATPLLVLDVYEHAYFIDYATGRKKYLEVFMQNIDWKSANAWLKESGLYKKHIKKTVEKPLKLHEHKKISK